MDWKQALVGNNFDKGRFPLFFMLYFFLFSCYLSGKKYYLVVKVSGVKSMFCFRLLKLHCGIKVIQLMNFCGNFQFQFHVFLSIPLDQEQSHVWKGGFSHYLVQYFFFFSDEENLYIWIAANFISKLWHMHSMYYFSARLCGWKRCTPSFSVTWLLSSSFLDIHWSICMVVPLLFFVFASVFACLTHLYS